MRRFKTVLGSSAVACAVCLGAVVPMAVASTTPATPVSAQLAEAQGGVLRDWEAERVSDGLYLDRIVGDANGATTVVIVTPGTEDRSLYPRVGGLVGGHDATVIDYPESFGPVIGGRTDHLLPFFAPGYDESKDAAIAGNLAVIEQITKLDLYLDDDGPRVVYTGYSQGADALGDAAEQGRDFLLAQNATVVLVSDPRSPWGVKAWAGGQPLLTPILAALGIENNGARDPESTGEVPVVSVIIVGDPVAHWQWQWLRPVSSLLVNAAGFATIHSGAGADNYSDLDRLELLDTLAGVDGNSEYQIYDARHPLALLAAMLFEGIGVEIDDETIDRWDAAAEVFYPVVAPTPDNAAVSVQRPAATGETGEDSENGGEPESQDLGADLDEVASGDEDAHEDGPADRLSSSADDGDTDRGEGGGTPATTPSASTPAPEPEPTVTDEPDESSEQSDPETEPESETEPDLEVESASTDTDEAA